MFIGPLKIQVAAVYARDRKSSVTAQRRAMKNKIQFIGRMLLIGVLVYYVFQETGPATAIFAALVCVALELETRFLRELTEILKSFEK